jgi:hypothetical protein
VAHTLNACGVHVEDQVILLLPLLQLEQAYATGIASPAEGLTGIRAIPVVPCRHGHSQLIKLLNLSGCLAAMRQVALCIQASVKALEVVLVDDRYQSEKIPSIRLKASSLSTTLSHDCTLLLHRRLQQEEPETVSNTS